MVDQICPDVGVATVRLLEAAGCDVAFPAAQTCCGQPACNAGEPEAAARLARHFVDVFAPYDAVVAPSGSCAAMVHHWYDRLLDGADRARAQSLAARTYELSQYLADELARDELARDELARDELARVDLGARVDAPVTVHDACHGLRILGTGDATRRLLTDAGATIVEMIEAETCCGFGGTFAVEHGEISGPLADAKLGHAADTSAEYLVSGDAACLLHLEGRRRRTGVGPEPIHFAELLASGLR